jgi:hypothetical protein
MTEEDSHRALPPFYNLSPDILTMRLGGSERAAGTTLNYIATSARGQTPSSEMWSLAPGIFYLLVNRSPEWMAMDDQKGGFGAALINSAFGIAIALFSSVTGSRPLIWINPLNAVAR